MQDNPEVTPATMKSGEGSCFSADTLVCLFFIMFLVLAQFIKVRTAVGSKRMDELEVGDMVRLND
jgi:hypothetical protein